MFKAGKRNPKKGEKMVLAEKTILLLKKMSTEGGKITLLKKKAVRMKLKIPDYLIVSM